MRKTFSNLRQSRAAYIIQILIIVAIAIDYTFSTSTGVGFDPLFYLVLAMAAMPALLIPVEATTTIPARRALLILHHAVVATMLVFFVDAFGPYFQLLILLLLVSAVWQGVRGVVLSLTIGSLSVGVAAWLQFGGMSLAQGYRSGIYIICLAVLGLLFERVTHGYRLGWQNPDDVDQQLHFERTRLLSLINNMADAVIATDRKGKVLLYNGAALQLFDTNESLYNHLLSDLFQLKLANGKDVDIIAEVTRAGRTVVRDDLFFYSNDDSQVDLSISISPVSAPGSDRAQTGFILVLRDITKQKTLDEQRDEFISIAAHELRTPIAIAEANISTAMMPKFTKQLTDEGAKLLQQAHENVMFLSNLVNDLHVLAQAEKGWLETKSTMLDPAKFLNRLLEDYGKQAASKKLELKLDIEDDLDPVMTSLDAIKEIMQNFITNSLKYTEQGSITLMAFSDKEGDGVVFAVRDTGIGISATDQKHVFEKFYRSEDYRTRRSGGTGLGLYITKRLVERTGGRLWFESKLNKGSTFYCAVPRTPILDESEEPSTS